MSTTYFIQDTRQHVGNCMLWWANGGGYTTHLDEAREYTEKEACSIERTSGTDKAWPADQVRAAASLQVDVQRLRRVVDAPPLAEPSANGTDGTAHEDDGRNGVAAIGGMREAVGQCNNPEHQWILHYEFVATTNLAEVDATCPRCLVPLTNLKWCDSK